VNIVVPCGRTDRQTDRQTDNDEANVAFPNIANAHQKLSADNDEANVAFPNIANAHQKLSDFFPYRKKKLKINAKRKPTRFEIFTAGTSRRQTSDIAWESWYAWCE
jgi:hypothetical protein